MSAVAQPVCFGVVVGTRGFFNPALAVEGRKSLLATLDKLGYSTVITAENATPNGAIETAADARKCAAHFKSNRDKIDGIIVTLPNFGDELGIVQALELAGLDVPVLVHAFDDELDKVDVAHRRDAFCGKVSVCNNLYQYGIPWTDTTEHTCAVECAEFAADLDRFARGLPGGAGPAGSAHRARSARGPARSRRCASARSSCRRRGSPSSPWTCRRSLLPRGRSGRTRRSCRKSSSLIRGYGRIPDRVPADNVLRQARLSVAIDRWMTENGCAASAIQCWESIQKNYGCATCLSMSLMGEEGMPSACEVDITGAVSMHALRLASGNAPGFLDWNNNYGAGPQQVRRTPTAPISRRASSAGRSRSRSWTSSARRWAGKTASARSRER